ncbi:MAG: TatD family hydrolase [bacterium]|nr:TatD family hydrolase [bacterium]
MIVDTHCHYNLEPLLSSWETHWENAKSAGVIASVVVGTNLDTSKKAIELAGKNPHFAATVGFHPNYFKLEEQLDEISQLEALASAEKVVAIGEIGLDYFRLSDSPADEVVKEVQKQALRAQLAIAAKYSLPTCIHVRDKGAVAYFELLEILSSVKQESAPCILHCVSGPSEYIQKAVQLGVYIGVAGNSTYPKSDTIRSAIALAPIDKILLETDAPYLPPQSHRGQTCEPWMMSETADSLYINRKITADQILSNTQAAFLDKIPV